MSRNEIKLYQILIRVIIIIAIIAITILIYQAQSPHH